MAGLKLSVTACYAVRMLNYVAAVNQECITMHNLSLGNALSKTDACQRGSLSCDHHDSKSQRTLKVCVCAQRKGILYSVRNHYSYKKLQRF